MLLHELIETQAKLKPDAPALGCKNSWVNYQTLSNSVDHVACFLASIMDSTQERVAIYTTKSVNCVSSIFGVSKAGGVAVVINPILKKPQVDQIVADCAATVLITSVSRYQQLDLVQLPSIKHVVLFDGSMGNTDGQVHHWHAIQSLDITDLRADLPQMIATDLAAIFYTSGSTGRAKGVVLTHQNLVIGAQSVVAYLPTKANDKLLAVLPLSFDYGFSQLTIAFLTGASCYLQDYLFVKDIVDAVRDHQLTSMALVPPLWVQLAKGDWQAQELMSLRYFCNTGGAMPSAVLTQLRQRIPHALPYMMFGLTEAFRSCYLPPEHLDERPTSFGKAIPNARVQVINEQGNECAPFEHGELVHSGVLVSQGYWNDPDKTQARFKRAPVCLAQRMLPQWAVWSGDIVYQDHEGFFYFVSRKDDLIKTSGYRVSPQEVEEVVYTCDHVSEVVVIGVPHSELGQAIVAIVNSTVQTASHLSAMIQHCRAQLPIYMVPKRFIYTEQLPKNSNGKFDRNHWHTLYGRLFQEQY
ncbi:acyl-CoA ligase (AMP-forming), exosortase A system-associated [Pseudoalteromonas aurantia]|uniref:Acyl-CoA ligase (AMP-forming), exosortase A system-associated n=1 Tax=Pseudoalteromonas aurantia 208 TaxID=1314867 RepID=A0ABR9EJW5_9GAMM|nr:acyl-CoA ligase (AMP-forming), exosortase A system-associated [Pseudoalteromonas aurantia]MBE0370550.1 hypothetical protein [Pseudoalteromonas aurantia 208]